MSWGAQNRSKDAKTRSAGRGMSKKSEPGLWPIQPYSSAAQRIRNTHVHVHTSNRLMQRLRNTHGHLVLFVSRAAPTRNTHGRVQTAHRLMQRLRNAHGNSHGHLTLCSQPCSAYAIHTATSYYLSAVQRLRNTHGRLRPSVSRAAPTQYTRPPSRLRSAMQRIRNTHGHTFTIQSAAQRIRNTHGHLHHPIGRAALYAMHTATSTTFGQPCSALRNTHGHLHHSVSRAALYAMHTATFTILSTVQRFTQCTRPPSPFCQSAAQCFRISHGHICAASNPCSTTPCSFQSMLLPIHAPPIHAP
jgi:hypothetical protein